MLIIIIEALSIYLFFLFLLKALLNKFKRVIVFFIEKNQRNLKNLKKSFYFLSKIINSFLKKKYLLYFINIS